MAELLSHIVTEDGVDHRIVDLEAQAMVGRVQEQVGNINLADLDFELPTDPEFNSVTTQNIETTSGTFANGDLTVKSNGQIEFGKGNNKVTVDKQDIDLFQDFLEGLTSIEGVYF